MPTPSEIQTCIDNLNTNSDPSKFTVLAAETSNANTGISFSVASVDDLPDLSTISIPPGQIVFVESIGVPVVSSENAWKGLDGRLLRSDFTLMKLFAWGKNGDANLGDGTTVSTCSPVREFCSSGNWCQVSVGDFNHTTAIKTSGELWSWGQNSQGRLGDGTTTVRCSPVREFCSATDWCQASAGSFHIMAIKTSGELWAWGCNVSGMLGDGRTTHRCSPIREICSATDWCQASAGANHSAAIKTSGELWSWGSNGCGRLGDGTATNSCSPVREFCSATDWCYVSADCQHSAAIKTSGELWAWGNNLCGRLGFGSAISCCCSPVRERCSATDWCQVSAGATHTLAIKTSGELWSWGGNICGVLGDGTTTTRCSPVRERCSATDWCQVGTGTRHTLAIKTSGELWGWGSNYCGVVGDGTFVRRCSPVREICSATDWCQAAVSCIHSAAITVKQ